MPTATYYCYHMLINMCIYIYIHIHTYVRTYIHTYIICVFIMVCMYVCVYVCTYIYIYAYTHIKCIPSETQIPPKEGGDEKVGLPEGEADYAIPYYDRLD